MSGLRTAIGHGRIRGQYRPSRRCPKALAVAERALQLDDTLGEAHVTLGLINRYIWRWGEADKEFRRAIELNPNYPTTRHWYSVSLRDYGRLDEALEQIKRHRNSIRFRELSQNNLGYRLYCVEVTPMPPITALNKMIEVNPYGGVVITGSGWRILSLDAGGGVESVRKGC